MHPPLYENIVNYILANQNNFYRLAYSYVKNQEDALDIVQNAVCKALENYETLRNPDAIKTWFYRILVNESLMLLRSRKKEILTSDELNSDIPYYEKAYEPNDNSLFDNINHLDETTQTIIKLRFYEELSLKEIAELMEMNLNTIKARLYRGLNLLKLTIKEKDYE